MVTFKTVEAKVRSKIGEEVLGEMKAHLLAEEVKLWGKVQPKDYTYATLVIELYCKTHCF